MATAGEGSDKAPARKPAGANGVSDEAKRLVEYAIGEAIRFKQAVSAATDAAVFSARSGLSQVISASSDSLQEAQVFPFTHFFGVFAGLLVVFLVGSQGLVKWVKSEYTAYEDLSVEKIKVTRPRKLSTCTHQSSDHYSMLADAESKVNDLRQSVNLVKNESRKALKAEEEMERGRKALMFISNFVSQVKHEKKSLSNTASKIVNYGIPL
ncbi:hypothetical protein MA16_Dca017722 [Dendrobium catenatum]|uniref:Uncharacterized protein n=1 Tax=Dendrobium catenatum TaxID=906689 RepID=A0A2I0VY86_9ASPA|nr:hypothetical protein MA16_Dca017722 [Dendrobium catenatum]